MGKIILGLIFLSGIPNSIAQAAIEDSCFARIFEAAGNVSPSHHANNLCKSDSGSYAQVRNVEELDCLLKVFDRNNYSRDYDQFNQIQLQYCKAFANSANNFSDYCFARIFGAAGKSSPRHHANNLCKSDSGSYAQVQKVEELDCLLKVFDRNNYSRKSDDFNQIQLQYCKAFAASNGAANAQQNVQVTLPDQTNVILKNEVIIEGDERCGVAKSGVRGVQCWVCQEKAKKNDRMLDPRDPRDPQKRRIMVIKEFELVKLTELAFNIVDDGSITDLRCLSRRPISIKHRNDLIKILEDNDLKVVLPSPVKE